MKRIVRSYSCFQVLEEVEDLGLHRHVEGGDDLVAHQQLRLEDQGPGDADALALAARELARAARPVDVGVDAHLVEHGSDVSTRSSLDPIFQMVSGSDTMSMTRRRGFSEEIGSWKIICTCVRSARRSPRLRLVSSVSPKPIVPDVAFSTWTIARPVVDLPHPDSPTRPSVSPWRRAKVMPATACTVCVALAERDVQVLDGQQRVGCVTAVSVTPAPGRAARGGSGIGCRQGEPAGVDVARFRLDQRRLLQVALAPARRGSEERRGNRWGVEEVGGRPSMAVSRVWLGSAIRGVDFSSASV